MNRSKVFKSVAAIGAAVALIPLGQGTAGAAAASWGSSYPQLGNAKCTEAQKLTDSQHVILGCISWNDYWAWSYAIVMNGNNSARYLPEAKVIASGGGIVTCPAGGIGKQSTKFCEGGLRQRSGNCPEDVYATTDYYWHRWHHIWTAITCND